MTKTLKTKPLNSDIERVVLPQHWAIINTSASVGYIVATTNDIKMAKILKDGLNDGLYNYTDKYDIVEIVE